jgi:hypothetical protein
MHHKLCVPALERVAVSTFLVALASLSAFVAISCDRDTPTQPTNTSELLVGTAGTTTFSARATGAFATVLGVKTGLCGVGPLPPQGGEEGKSLLAARLEGTVAASFFHSIVFGHGDRCVAFATGGDVDVRVGGQHILACAAMSGSEAKCVSGSAQIWGDSQIGDLRINGQTIVVTGQPNQTILLPLGAGRIVINEQIRSAGLITVRALRVSVVGAADVVVCETQAGITCGEVHCDPAKDCVTGGGWITGTPTGSKATFGVSGGIKNGAPWGHLTYVDHANGATKVKGTGVTSYTAVNATTRRITGTCEINGQAGFTYEVEVADNGEPGRNDTLRIRLSNGYAASGALQGGNIQLHTPCK